LNSAEQLWQGAKSDGLRALLSSEQHELANRIDSAYQDSRQQLTALKQPLSKLLSNDSGRAQLNALYDSFGRLHRLHETELAKALDIQLGFNANDGD
ncbi:MAG: imelysin family protein, partial [Pseudomonas sp.]